MELKKRERAQEFKLQPQSHKVHWHLHCEPPHSFALLFRNNTFSPFSPWDLFFLMHLPQNEAILGEGEKKKSEKETQRRKVNWMSQTRATPAWQFATPYGPCDSLLYIVCFLIEVLTREEGMGVKKNDMWQASHLSCQRVISSTFKPRLTHLYAFPSEGDPGRNQPTHPGTAGEWRKDHNHSGKHSWLAGAKGNEEWKKGMAEDWEGVKGKLHCRR